MESNDNHFAPGVVEKSLRALNEALDPRGGEKVCIAYPHLDNFGANFVDSVLRMAAYDKQHGNHLLHNSGLLNNGAIASVWGRATELATARNVATAAFLSSESDWLLWIDTDMGFEPDALEKLLAVANPDTAPIVGALCFIETDYSHDLRGGLRSALAPTLYDWVWIEPKHGQPGAYKMISRTEWPPDQVTRVGATGCGMLLTHRSVYEKISAWLQDEKQGAPPNIWFERIPGPDGERCGEDVSFCLRAHQVGLPILVHTGVTTTHQKTIWYGAPEYRQKPSSPPALSYRPLPPDQWPKLMVNRQAAEEAARTSPMRDKQVAEATERVAVVVPVAKRDNAAPFLDTLANSLTPAQRERVTVYVIGDINDSATTDRWLDQLHRYENTMILSFDFAEKIGTFAEKVNRAFEVTEEPWLFLVGDDVHFHPAWLDQAMETARTTGAHVVGTNDLGNPAVLAGEHATHMLVRREYVEHTGASWDGPGVLCHEGYRHWFVDNELVAAAKQVGAWAPCLLAVVEHMHPIWKKGADDAVYRLGQDAAEADRELWFQRFNYYRYPEIMYGVDGAALRMYEHGK